MKLFLFMLGLVFSSQLYAITVTEDTETVDVLSQSQIFIDRSNSATIQTIDCFEDRFTANKTDILQYGMSPGFTVWVKFELANETSAPVKKVLKHTNPVTTDLTLYSENEAHHEGLFHVAEDRTTTTPVFQILLPAHTQRTYYLKAYSHILPLTLGMTLDDPQHYYKEEMRHQRNIALFFGGMAVLFVYNLFVFFYTRDVSYLYYIGFLLGAVLNQAHVTGYMYLLFPQSLITVVGIYGIPFIIALLVLSSALFVQSFVNTRQYPVPHRIYKILLYPVPFVALLSFTGTWAQLDLFYFLIVQLYTAFITFYAAIKRNRQAYFILVGQACVAVVYIFTVLDSAGVYSVYSVFKYPAETGLLLEALIFSIALADRLKQLQNQKNRLNAQLIQQQRSEEIRLKYLIGQRTNALNEALQEKELLFQELHHRVKNNMQMILSLLNLQNSTTQNNVARNLLQSAQNRIKAMNHLHELLYLQKNIMQIDARTYFERIITDLKSVMRNTGKDIAVTCRIETTIPLRQAIHCGIILNELVSNSMKYAFDEKGEIDISLTREGEHCTLSVKDNGKGYVPKNDGKSLGLKIVDILVTMQLKGSIDTQSRNGVTHTITWKCDE